MQIKTRHCRVEVGSRPEVSNCHIPDSSIHMEVKWHCTGIFAHLPKHRPWQQGTWPLHKIQMTSWNRSSFTFTMAEDFALQWRSGVLGCIHNDGCTQQWRPRPGEFSLALPVQLSRPQQISCQWTQWTYLVTSLCCICWVLCQSKGANHLAKQPSACWMMHVKDWILKLIKNQPTLF